MKILSKEMVKEVRVKMDRGVMIGRYYSESKILRSAWIPQEWYAEEFNLQTVEVLNEEDKTLMEAIKQVYNGNGLVIDDAIYEISNRPLTAYYHDVAEYLCQGCDNVLDDCECEEVCIGDCDECCEDRETCCFEREDGR
ncbi:hypothetical protein [Romboutsia sp.]|uniref:hypothetical protein n=1 Tax=Romboutsia sp. TaxID=1965302 RepID=UPI003F3E5939